MEAHTSPSPTSSSPDAGNYKFMRRKVDKPEVEAYRPMFHFQPAVHEFRAAPPKCDDEDDDEKSIISVDTSLWPVDDRGWLRTRGVVLEMWLLPLYKIFAVFNVLFTMHCAMSGFQVLIAGHKSLSTQYAPHAPPLYQLATTLLPPFLLAMFSITPCWCYAHNLYHLIRKSHPLSRSKSSTPRDSGMLLKLDMLGTLTRDLALRPLYAHVSHLAPSNVAFASTLTTHGPTAAYLLHHAWSYYAFQLPYCVVVRYPLGPALVVLFYLSFANVVMDSLLVLLREGGVSLGYMAASLVMSQGTLFLLVWLALGMLHKGRTVDGPRFPMGMKQPVVYYAHTVRTMMRNVRISDQATSSFTISMVGTLFPFFKVVIGMSTVSGAMMDAAGTGLVIFMVLSAAQFAF